MGSGIKASDNLGHAEVTFDGRSHHISPGIHVTDGRTKECCSSGVHNTSIGKSTLLCDTDDSPMTGCAGEDPRTTITDLEHCTHISLKRILVGKEDTKIPDPLAYGSVRTSAFD